MIIITGLGRSGTSFTSKVLSGAGAPFMGDWYNETIKAGMEDPTIVKLNNLLRDGSASSLDDAILQAGGEIKSKLQDGIIVKDPKFMQTLDFWIEAGINIEHIIYCARDYREIFDSSMRSGRGSVGGVNGIYSFHGAQVYFTYLERIFFKQAAASNIPVTKVYFPKSVKDFSEIEKLSFITGMEKLKKAWENTRSPEKISGQSENVVDVDAGEKLVELSRKVAELEDQLFKCEKTGPLKKLDRDIRKKLLYPLIKKIKGA